jgi:NADPH:quinone reductase
VRAAWFERQGGARDVLRVGTLPDPEPGPGEVRVRIAVSGLNPSDIRTRSGSGGAPMPFARIVPHQDGAGIVDRVGAGVPAERIGERVWIYMAQWRKPHGSAADYAVVPSERAVALPARASFETGAALGVPAMTAHRCLFADGALRGKRVLVQGGAGAVGTAAILLAKWAGAWVAATVGRPGQAAVAGAAGADLVIDRHRESVVDVLREATAGEGVARIVDVDLAANIDTAIGALARDGVAAAYSTGAMDTALSIPFMPALLNGLAFRFVYVYTMPADAQRQARADISACLAAGAYHPAIALDLPLARIADAHEAQERGKAIGKILVRP